MDAHFAAKSQPAAERELRAHLHGCAECRDRYERLLMLADVDPAAPRAKQRLAAGLGLTGSRRRLGRPLLALASASAAALLLLWIVRAPGPSAPEYQVRGAGSQPTPTRLVAYEVTPGARPLPVGRSMASRAELAFAYTNPRAKKHLLVFGMDTSGRVYWYHPAWRDPGKDPVAIRIRGAPGLHELPTAIRHDIAGDSMTLAGVFVDRPLHVRQVEQLLKRHPPGKLPLPGAVQTVQRVDIRR